MDYPFQFLITATFILVIWGSLGGAFGLQGLFLDEDPLTQVLIGGTVMLLFAAIVVHYVALGSSRRGWWASLHGLTGVLRGLNSVTRADLPVQAALGNGFLERLSAADIEAIDVVARREEADPSGGASAARRSTTSFATPSRASRFGCSSPRRSSSSRGSASCSSWASCPRW